MTRPLRVLLGALGIAIVTFIAYLTPAVSGITRVLLGLLSGVTLWFVWRWPQLEQRLAPAAQPASPRLFDLAPAESSSAVGE
jgi:hypothetical protein